MAVIVIRRGPSFEYKIRKIGHSKTSGDIFGLTVPKKVAYDFMGKTLNLSVDENKIVYEVKKVEQRKKGETKDINVV